MEGGVFLNIVCIDLKSFYASVECVLRGVDPFHVPLVVSDLSRGKGAIVLAVSPKLKAMGVKSRCRIFDLPKDVDIIYAKPRMKKYIEFASKIYDIYMQFVDPQDIHIYSIDEAFLDFTKYLKYYHKTDIELAKMVKTAIEEQTGLIASCGVGENLFQAKVALDCLAKKDKDGIAALNSNNFSKRVGNLKPITEIWGIGRGVGKRLAQRGITTLNELAAYPVEALEKEFGILGKELSDHAKGVDSSTIAEIKAYKPVSKSFGHGQVMLEDYRYQDMVVILQETIDEIVTELVTKKMCCQLIGLGIGYSMKIGGGFYRQKKLIAPTNSKKVLVEHFLQLYYNNIQDKPIRSIHVRVGELSYENYIQPDLFHDPALLNKEHEVYKAMAAIKEKYGKKSVNMAISYTEKATKVKRSILIGGHNAE